MRGAGKIGLWVVGGLALLAALVLGALQAGPVKVWLADVAGRAASTPGSAVRVGAISGFVPFDVRVAEIDLADSRGTWLTVRQAALAWSPSALLRGVARIDHLTADSIAMLRQPEAGPPEPGAASSGVSLPRLPVGVELLDLSINSAAIGAAAGGGEDAAARLSAHGLLAPGRARLSVRLARVDGQPGAGAIDADYDQATNALDLAMDVDEPTGALLDAALDRTDKLPLKVTLKGAGPLDGWRGRLIAAARDVIHLDTTIEFAKTLGSRIALDGSVGVAALLPENARAFAGNDITFHIVAAENGRNALMLAPSRIALAGGAITMAGGQAEDGRLSGTLSLAIRDAADLQPLVGGSARGALKLDATLSGTADQPTLAMTESGQMTFGRVTVDGLSLDATVKTESTLAKGDPNFMIDLSARTGDIHDAAPGGADFGQATLTLAGTTDAKGGLIDLASLSAAGAGFAVTAKGSVKDGAAAGDASLTGQDLAVIGRLAGMELSGAVSADLHVSTAADKTIAVRASLKGDRLRTGIPAADALLAGPVTLDALGGRSAKGVLTVDRLTLQSQQAKIEGDGSFSPTDDGVSANLKASLNDLSALSAAAASKLAGVGALTATLGGTVGAPSVQATASLDRFAFAATRIDHLDARIAAPQGLAGSATVQGRIASGRLGESFDAAGSKIGDRAYRIDRLRLTGNGGAVNAALLLDLAGKRVSGKVNAAIPDLSIWSPVIGQTISGGATASADIPATAGRQGPVRATIDRLAVGAASNAIALSHAALDGRIAGDLAKPDGTMALTLAGLTAGGATLSSAQAHATTRGTTVTFDASGAGRAKDPISFDVAGSADRVGDSLTLRLATLTAASGAETLALKAPVTARIAPDAYSVKGLDLNVAGGVLTGDAELSPEKLSADLRLRQLPLHPLALLAGRQFVAGTVNGRITLNGTTRRPEAHIALTTKGLDLETDGPQPRPALSLSANADWLGDRATVDVKLGAGSGESLSITGSAPFAFDLASLTALRPPNPELALKVTGGGRLENLTAIAPLGEDRLSGAFAIDVAIGGTIAAPNPSGRIAVTAGRYANQALGTEFDAIDLSVTGAGQRFVLDHLKATDGASGTLDASGAADLGAKPASVGVDLALSGFRVAHSDNATVIADGKLKLAGNLAGMQASGALTVRRAELYIPDRLPASVVDLHVIEIGEGRQAAAETTQSTPVAPIALAITLDAPGQIFVRGHGVTSEWRTHLDIGGTSAAPSIRGNLTVANGSIDLLGQSFNIDRGAVRFGGTDLNPVLDVQASASASGVTALVNVTGTAAAPKIALSSTPVLPQDEILSRVLFGENVGSLTASQGLQLAAAAASLAQGGPGVLDKVRGAIGLDRLDIGAGGSNPNGTQGAASGTTVSGGKYIANGVFVGVQQGLNGASQAQVQVEVTPNLSVTSTFGAASGSGFGAKYSIDY